MINLPFVLFALATGVFVLGWFCPWDPDPETGRKLTLTAFLLVLLLFLGSFVTFRVVQSMILIALASWFTGYSLARLDIEWSRRRKPFLSPGLFYLLLLLVVLVTGYLRILDLGEFGLRLDERFHYRTAMGYLRTGFFRQWDFASATATDPYHRAAAFTWLVAQSFKAFGVSLWAGRLVSLVWGMLLLIPVYFIGRKLTLSRYWLVVLCFLVGLSPFAITISRWLRLYAMFATLFCATVLLLYELITATGWLRRTGVTISLILVGGVAVETHLLTLTLLLSLTLFLLSEQFLVQDGLGVANRRSGKIISLALVIIIVTTLVLLGGRIHAEINEGIRISWSYPAVLYEDLYGYSFGPLALLTAFVISRETPFERYLWWVILPPIVILMFATDRFYQFRYAGHVSLLALPFFVLTGQRLVNCAKESGRTILAVGLSLFVLLAPLKDLPGRLDYIWEGNMGYVHFRGVESPRYRLLLEKMIPVLDEDHHVVALHLYEKYRHELQSTGASVEGVSVPGGGTLMETTRTFRKNEGFDHQWLLIPTHARESFDRRFYRRLDRRFQRLLDPDRFEFFVYYRRIQDDPDQSTRLPTNPDGIDQ